MAGSSMHWSNGAYTGPNADGVAAAAGLEWSPFDREDGGVVSTARDGAALPGAGEKGTPEQIAARIADRERRAVERTQAEALRRSERGRQAEGNVGLGRIQTTQGEIRVSVSMQRTANGKRLKNPRETVSVRLPDGRRISYRSEESISDVAGDLLGDKFGGEKRLARMIESSAAQIRNRQFQKRAA